MTISRRTFIEISSAAAMAALADDLFGLPQLLAQTTGGGKPSAALTSLADVALATAKKMGATYADIRINRYKDQFTALRSSPDITTGKVNNVPNVGESQSFGFGVRVIANGTWGFASSPIVTKAEIARVAAEAVAVAKANSVLQRSPVRLAPSPTYVDVYRTPFKKDPFDVPIPEKLALLEKVTSDIRSVPKVFSATAAIGIHSEDKFFASSEGSRIQQYIVQTTGNMSAQARDVQTRISRTRNYTSPPETGGWELIEKADLGGNGKRIGEEVVEHLTAPAVTAGKKDLILMPNHLALTIHESIGHSTELDRAIGYEANFAGTSFLTLDKLGKYRVGSDLMNIVGDRTLPGAMSTIGYDDDGVKTTSFPIIEKGIFVGYQTIRDQAHIVGDKASRGCCNADSWDSIPFQRMPNVWLKPNP
ncbi:MAG TPA: TldD/PmbA family protein, partial [Terriglobales bacterium]|nr:TldD/PmbA family protein [Terriglobales bacterium]